jgi:hypothetical protein
MAENLQKRVFAFYSSIIVNAKILIQLSIELIFLDFDRVNTHGRDLKNFDNLNSVHYDKSSGDPVRVMTL